VDAEEERSRAACEQGTQEAQQGKRKRHSLERQRCSKAAHDQENQKAQQKREKAACPLKGKAQQEKGIVNRRSGEPSKC